MCPPLHAAVGLFAPAKVAGADLPLHGCLLLTTLALQSLGIAALCAFHHVYNTLLSAVEIIMYLLVGYH